MRNFWSDRKGNIAVLFALAIVPIIGGVGAAVDYSMASAYRTDMQKALDSTALAMSKLLPMDEAKMNEVGLQYFLASMGQHDLTNLNLEIVPHNGKVTISVTGDYTPKIANIFGATQFTIGTSSEAIWNMGKVEVALVLDNSLSMNQQGRIQALRAAAVDLINVLQNAARQPGDAKVGIVAFDAMVNVGYTYGNRPNWVRFDWWGDNYGSCNKSGSSYNTRSACEAQYVCTKSQYTTQNTCTNNKGSWVKATWTPDSPNSWNGCVYDRWKDNGLNYDVNDGTPDTTYAYNAPNIYTHPSETTAQRRTKYPAAKCYGNPPQAVTPLTENWDLLRQKATNLTPTGYTNITIGLVWGWHLLSPAALHTEGAAYDTEDLTKVIILMTDGDNTRSLHSNNSNDIDARTEAVCDNIKATNQIQIYTIRLMDGNETLLRNCATNTSMYYNVQQASQLAAAFNAIGAEIASLHLSK